MTAQAAKAAIERTIKLNQGAAYIWDAGQVDRDPEPVHARLPPQVPGAARPDRLGRLRGLHLRHEGLRRQRPGEVVRCGARRRHRAVRDRHWNKGQEIELVSRPTQVLGRLERRALPRGRVPGRAVRPRPPRSSAARRPGHLRRTPDPAAVGLVQERSRRSVTSQRPSRTCSPCSTRSRDRSPTCASARRSPTPSTTTGIVAALHGGGTQSHGVIPPGLLGHFDSCRATRYDLAKATPLLSGRRLRPGRQEAAEPDAHLHPGRHRRAARRDADEVEPRHAEHQPRRAVAGLADAVGEGEVLRHRQAAGHPPLLLVARLRRSVLAGSSTSSTPRTRRTSTSPTTRTRRSTR